MRLQIGLLRTAIEINSRAQPERRTKPGRGGGGRERERERSTGDGGVEEVQGTTGKAVQAQREKRTDR